ncbi:MAG: hypothetical protein KY475_02465 [Planctomycetes bacterium]|nr:hypothetical protein [Planctomycetota bacterium]
MAFVTGAFPGLNRYPDASGDWREKKSWNAVVHRLDADGNHLGTDVRRGGLESDGRDVAGAKAWRSLDQMLAELELENAELCDICVKPFSIEIDDVVYALEYSHERDGDYEYECVMLWPNDIMFHPPWDSGDYST